MVSAQLDSKATEESGVRRGDGAEARAVTTVGLDVTPLRASGLHGQALAVVEAAVGVAQIDLL